GNQVVTAALNWPGAVGPISISGLQPRFVDVDLTLAGIDEDAAANTMEPDVAAVLVTHLFGNNILAPRTRAAARSRGIAIIDDVCQSIGAVKNIVNGMYLDSDALALSGNGAKHLGAGELGFVLTKDPNLIEHVDHVSLTSSSRNGARIFSAYSQGYNYRPNVFSAAIASSRIKGLDKQLKKRRNNATILWQMIRDLPGLSPLFDPADHSQSMLNFPLRIELEILGFPQGPAGRDFIIKLLQAEGVPVWVWLTRPVFEYLPPMRGRWNAADFPNTMRLLDTMFYVSEIAPPNDAEIMKLYADAFHKIWSALPKILGRVREVATAA
ncbi:DegT/DnrJ/EryC1/StrS aminotransferase family protein, partial [Mesorhizobium sp. M2A.F.Ca.ET.046.02.1.1]